MRLALALALLAAPALADDARPSFGPAGLLSGKNKIDLPPILLSVGEPLAAAPLSLTSGTYYEIEIEADGSGELALVAPDFFRAIWIDEIVIEGIEIRPLGLDSLEFDEAGTVEIGFVAIKPGRYVIQIPGALGDDQRLEVVIE